jgi:hypothetical protein
MRRSRMTNNVSYRSKVHETLDNKIVAEKRNKLIEDPGWLLGSVIKRRATRHNSMLGKIPGIKKYRYRRCGGKGGGVESGRNAVTSQRREGTAQLPLAAHRFSTPNVKLQNFCQTSDLNDSKLNIFVGSTKCSVLPVSGNKTHGTSVVRTEFNSRKRLLSSQRPHHFWSLPAAYPSPWSQSSTFTI